MPWPVPTMHYLENCVSRMQYGHFALPVKLKGIVSGDVVCTGAMDLSVLS